MSLEWSLDDLWEQEQWGEEGVQQDPRLEKFSSGFCMGEDPVES